MECIQINTEYIELYKLLKLAGLVPTGGIAKMMIADGLVKVDGQVETRKACKIRPKQVVCFEDEEVCVQRTESLGSNPRL